MSPENRIRAEKVSLKDTEQEYHQKRTNVLPNRKKHLISRHKSAFLLHP
jgi:hypothetical protein